MSESLNITMDFSQFLRWEAATRDTLDVKRIYIDMAGDLAAGVMLSEIVYWHLPAANGTSRLSVLRNDHLWIAVRRSEWWERCRLSPDQADYALGKLIQRGLVEKRLFRFNGQPTVHIRLCSEAFLAAFQALLDTPLTNPYDPQPEGGIRNGNGKIPIPGSESQQTPITETTHKIPPPPPAGAGRLREPPGSEIGYPATPLEAERHPDLALFTRLNGGLFPGQGDWRTVIDRLSYLRRRHPDLDEQGLEQAGKPFWSAWVERGYSPTHPDWLEWWMSGRVPPRRGRRRAARARSSPPEVDDEALRQLGEKLLVPEIERQEAKNDNRE